MDGQQQNKANSTRNFLIGTRGVDNFKKEISTPFKNLYQ
jgi:hypothetical protein